MLLRKRLANILPPCTGCPLCGELTHIDRMPLSVVNGELIGGEITYNPCPGAKRLIVTEPLTVEQWNEWAAKVLAECHNPASLDVIRRAIEPQAGVA